MSYIDNNLLPNEHIVYRTQIHKIIFLRPIGWLLVAIIIEMTAGYINLPTLTHILALIPFILAILEGINALIRYQTTEFGVTDKRVIVKVGFISRTTSENFLQKIENIQVDQSIAGRLLDYGTIIIHGTGGTREPFILVPQPLLFRKKIQEQVEKVISNQ